MSFLSKLFGKKPAPTRELKHPSQLIKGDIITLDDSFALPMQLKGQQFQVDNINCYQYQHEIEPEWVLSSSQGHTIYMTLEQDDELRLLFNLKLTKAQIDELFDLDQFSQIFAQPHQSFSQLLNLTSATRTALGDWLTSDYHQTSFAEYGYFHRQRSHHELKMQPNLTGEAVEFYQLTDQQNQFVISIEVYEDGTTEVCLGRRRPLTDIREYWPAPDTHQRG